MHLEQEMEKNNIEHIKLFNDIYSAKKKGQFIYYRDDGHWTSVVNEIIAKKLVAKIQDLSKIR